MLDKKGSPVMKNVRKQVLIENETVVVYFSGHGILDGASCL